jgi:hypothetical protein
MVGVDSSFALALEVPFSVRDFNMCDIRWIKRDVCDTSNLTNDRTVNDRDILNDATIAQCNGYNVVVHSGLALR